jgi:hypothetical protein
MRKQTTHSAPSQERRTLGLRWAVVRRHTPAARNDHTHLFSTESNTRHLRESLRQADEGLVRRVTIEDLSARYGLGEL